MTSQSSDSVALSRSSRLLRGCLFSLLLVLLVELALRAAGHPAGRYRAGVLEGVAYAGGPWEPGYGARIISGPVPYDLSVNAHGFRGPELRPAQDPAALRLVAIGDSFTEGFFVDDAATYPAQLQSRLHSSGLDIEVINAARGGGSIDRFKQILMRCVLPLNPDVVLLTFVSNDLADLGWFPLEQHKPAWFERLGSIFVGHTAIGEALLDWVLGAQPSLNALAIGDQVDERYQIEGGADYQVNAGLFMQRYGERDGLGLGTRLESMGQRAFDIYCEQLQAFAALCLQDQIQVLFIYAPAYPEIYTDRPVSIQRTLLAAQADELGWGFLDLTPGLRAASLDEGLGPLHLAPLDFHLNPTGNRIVAREVTRALEQGGLLKLGVGK